MEIKRGRGGALQEILQREAGTVRFRCDEARRLLLAGENASARVALGGLWAGPGRSPATAGLGDEEAADLLFCAGALEGRLAAAGGTRGGQEAAKDLLGSSLAAFERLGLTEKAAAAQLELGFCYLREGAFDDAKVFVDSAAARLPEEATDLRCLALLRQGAVARNARRDRDALDILTAAGPAFDRCGIPYLRGCYHSELASTLQLLGAGGAPEEFKDRALVDRALIEYAAASAFFEEAGSERNLASTENNLAHLFVLIGEFASARGHLTRARSIFSKLGAKTHVAQVDETRARALIGEGRLAEAELAAGAAVKVLSEGDALALLAEALVTRGVARARAGSLDRARADFERAVSAGERAGDLEGAGVAALTMLEELSPSLDARELCDLYGRAASLLARTQRRDLTRRLVACSVRAVEAARAPEVRADDPADPAAAVFAHASEAARDLLAYARRIAPSPSPVLIQGETGTGKEVLARLIHDWSGRTGEMIVVNCASLSPELFESQLFGHLKGSFTGATENRQGMARRAVAGTLFLDEIGDLSSANQVKLLRLVDFREICPVGADRPQRVDVRFVAATNRPLDAAVAAGAFRQDLLYRLSAFELRLPPLRERREDVPALARHFIAGMERTYGRRLTFPDETLEAMKHLPLPGNARELRALIERAFATAPPDAIVTPERVRVLTTRGPREASLISPWANFDLNEEMRVLEHDIIKLALDEAGGEITRAARLLGVSHQTLIYKIKNTYTDLASARTPARTRRRSLIPKEVHERERARRAGRRDAQGGAT
jgi:transcriptional regulator with GAF, ATPase, and Fis domain